MSTRDPTEGPVVAAIQDLTRVTLALSNIFGSTAEKVRKLHELSIPPTRIAAILAIPLNQVHTELGRAKQRPTPKAKARPRTRRRATR